MDELPTRVERYLDLPRILSALRPERPGHLGEIAIRGALSASELSFLLATDAAADARPSFDGAGLVDRALLSAAALLESAADLLAISGVAPPIPAGSPAPSGASGLASLSALDPRHSRAIDRLTRAILCSFQSLPFSLGLEPTARDLRRRFDLPALPGPAADLPSLPFDAWIRPAALRSMPHGAEVPHGPEDRRFALTHQILEIWLALCASLIRGALDLAQRRAWGEASALLARAADILRLLPAHLDALGHMVSADFQPLRVALGGVELAASPGATEVFDATTSLLAPLKASLGEGGLALLDLLQRPERAPAEHAYLEAIARLESALAGLPLARHPRYASPPLPELDAARTALSRLADLGCGHRRGSLFLGEDRASKQAATARIPEAQMSASPERLQAIIDTSFALLTAGSADAYAHLFSGDGYIEDPRGSSPWRGEAQIRAYAATFLERFPGVKIAAIGAPAIKGNIATVSWSAIGPEISFTGEATFYFKASGQIAAVEVDWDPGALGRKLGYVERFDAGPGSIRPLTVALLGHPGGSVAKDLISALGRVPVQSWLPRKIFREGLAVEAIKWLSGCEDMGPGFADLLAGASHAVVLVQPAELAELPDLATQIADALKAAGVRRIAWVVPACGEDSLEAELDQASASIPGLASALIVRHGPLFGHLLVCRDEANAPSAILLPDAARRVRWTSARDVAMVLGRWIRDDLPISRIDVHGPEALTGAEVAGILAAAAQRADAGRAAAEKRFQQIDHNADGTLSKDELRAYLHAVGYGPGAVEAAIERADHDADGSLSFDEFFSELGASLGAVLGSLAPEIRCVEVTAAALSSRLVKRGFTQAAAGAFVTCLGGAAADAAGAGPEGIDRGPLAAWAFEHAVQFMDVHILPGNGVVASRDIPRDGVEGSESKLVRPDGQTLVCWRAKEPGYVRLRWAEADREDVVAHRYRAADNERTLEVRGDKLVGITVQGDWSGLRDASELLFSGDPVPAWKLTLFSHLGDLEIGDARGDASVMVCSCAKVTREKLIALIDQGNQMMTTLCNASRAVKFCGACRGEIEGILSERTRTSLLPQSR